MAAGGGGSFSAPAPPQALTFELVGSGNNAGWVEIPYPQILTDDGGTIFGWIDGSDGDVMCSRYDHASQTASTPFQLHAALGGEGTADNHDNPAFHVRSDGKYLVAYCRHADTTGLRFRVSTNAGDATAWGSEYTVDRGNQHDYPSFFQVGSTLWLLYRNTTSGQNANLCWIKSTDDGATWSGSTNTPEVSVYNGVSSHTPYWRLWLDESTGFIHVVVTDLEPNTASKLGHFYIDTADGKTYKSDGTEITATRPFLFTDITQIDDGTAGSTMTWGVTVDASHRPVAVYLRHLTSDNAIRRASWNGSAWTTEEVVSSVGGQLGINKFASGAAIDPLDPDRLWFPKVVSGTFEMYQYRKSGGTWSGTQLTSGSSRDQVWPAACFDSDGTIDVMWLDIDYTDDTTFGPSAVIGYGFG